MNPTKDTPPPEDGGGPSITGDFLADILIHLPLKTLTRFKSVSKDWFSIITSDEFRRLHTLRHPNPPPSSLILQPNFPGLFYTIHPLHKNPKFTPYKFKFPFPYPKILSTSNGLMLLRSQRNYLVHNPITYQSRRIAIDDCSDYPSIMGLILASHPSKPIHYTVVLVRANLESPPYFRVVQVYDSESHSWEIGSQPFTTNKKADFSSGVHCNGSVYDIGERSMARLKNPIGLDDLYRGDIIQQSNNHLYLIRQMYTLVQLLDLQKNGPFVEVLSCMHAHDLPFYRRCDDALLFDEHTSSFVLYRSRMIMSYSFADGRLEERADLRDRPFFRRDFLRFDSKNAFPFAETLAPV